MSKKVLFIDDEWAIAQANTQILKEKGFDSRALNSLKNIKEIVLEWIPDIIILDVKIGNENSIDFLPKLKKIAPQIPVVFISSHTEGSEIKRAIESGGEHYIKNHLMPMNWRPISISYYPVLKNGSLWKKGID